MSAVNVTIVPGSFPSGYCWPSSPQDFAIDLAGILTVNLDYGAAKPPLVQNTTPSASQRSTNTWLNTDTGHLLRYENAVGEWVANHPIPPSDSRRFLFTGLAAAVDTLDGGSAGTVGDAAGPFWEIDTAFAGRFPVGVGTIPGSSTVVAVGGTGGSDQITIAKANLPTDMLSVDLPIIGQSSVGDPEAVVANTYGSTSISGSGKAVDSTSSEFAARYYAKGRSEALGTGTALTATQPYIGSYWLKRTSRIYWTT